MLRIQVKVPELVLFINSSLKHVGEFTIYYSNDKRIQALFLKHGEEGGSGKYSRYLGMHCWY